MSGPPILGKLDSCVTLRPIVDPIAANIDITHHPSSQRVPNYPTHLAETTSGSESESPVRPGMSIKPIVSHLDATPDNCTQPILLQDP